MLLVLLNLWGIYEVCTLLQNIKMLFCVVLRIDTHMRTVV